MTANFSSPAMQYSVTFDDLMADTSYTLTVRIVVHANTTVDVVQAAMGSFMTLMFPSKLGMITALTIPKHACIDWDDSTTCKYTSVVY